MKAILRDYGTSSYKVKEVTLNGSGDYLCEGKPLNEANILSFVNIGNQEFVTCSNCGEMIRNTPKDIRDHLNRKTSHKGCFTCGFLRCHDNVNTKAKYVQNEDGSFHRTLVEDVVLKCGAQYYTQPEITNDKRLETCKYKNCTKEHIVTGNGFFSKHPNAFDDMITVDAITFKRIYKNGRYTQMQLKCRGVIEACANDEGIIDHFEVRTRNDYKSLYYSKKYNKLFYHQYGKYVEFVPNYYWSQDKIDYIKKTIANLYK